MNRFYAFLIVLIAISTSSLGCSMCCGPYDFDYPTFGGKHPRADRAYGRVGSVFSDPNAMVGGVSSDSNLAPQPAIRSEEPSDVELEETEDDLDKFRRELESITPKDGGVDELPGPDADETADPTARVWRNQLRSEWR